MTSRRSTHGLIHMLRAAALLLAAGTATAHTFAPSLLELRETAGGQVEVRWKQPSTRVMGSRRSARTPVQRSSRTTTPPIGHAFTLVLVARPELGHGQAALGLGLGLLGLAHERAR